jgi:phosphoribosylformimino-5-aminoimidazole carboxamide ribotide isomerase
LKASTPRNTRNTRKKCFLLFFRVFRVFRGDIFLAKGPAMTGMRILPVLDVQGGVVVRGVAGKRQEYWPIVSGLVPSSQPREVAKALREKFGFSEFYLADLDAISGGAPAWPIYRDLEALGSRLWVDAGVRDAGMAERLVDAGVERIVLGLETIQGPDVVARASRDLGAGRVVFSLDLKEGRPLGDLSLWDRSDACSIATQAIAVGVRALIVLDLARVGTGAGTGTEDLCARLATAYPDADVIAGGGVRDSADLQRLQGTGVRGVLVASALHDGRLRPEDLAPFSSAWPLGPRITRLADSV